MHQNNPIIAELNYSSLRQLELKLKIYKDGYITVSDFISLQELDNDIHLYKDKEKNTRGIMCKVENNTKVPILPETLARSYISYLHFHPENSHLSKQQIKRKINQDYHLINADEIIDRITKGCPFCSYAIVYRKPKHLFLQNDIPNMPRIAWYIDFFGSVTKSKGHKNIALACDPFTGYTIIKGIKNRSAKNIQEFILSSIICPFGIFRILIADNELSMDNSTNFQEFLDKYCISKRVTAVHTHHSLGIAERRISIAKTSIRNLTRQTNNEWSDIIGIINSSINKTVQSYGVSAEKAMFGAELDNFYKPLLFDFDSQSPEEYYENIKRITKEARSVLKRNKDRKAKENFAYVNRKTKERSFVNNQLAEYANLRLEANKGIKIKNVPCQIIETTKSTAYVKDLLTGNLSKQHYSNLNVLSHDEDVILPENWDLEIQRQFNNENRESARLTNDIANSASRTSQNEGGSQQSSYESANESP